jgi:hypothetical protein
MQPLLQLWCNTIRGEPAAAPAAVVLLLQPLVYQLQRCSEQLLGSAMEPAAATAAGAPAVRGRYELHRVLFGVQHRLGHLTSVLIAAKNQFSCTPRDCIHALERYPAVAEMQLQLLSAWTAQLHQDHVAKQQQQQQQQQPLCASAAESSSSSSSTVQQQPPQQQHEQQSGRQQSSVKPLFIPAFHQHPDMLQLLPGGQEYLDAAAVISAGWGLSDAETVLQLQDMAASCSHFISCYLRHTLASSSGQQELKSDTVVLTAAGRLVLELPLQRIKVVTAAAVRLVLELQLLAAKAVQRERQNQVQPCSQQLQQQVEQVARHSHMLLSSSTQLLEMQIKALAVTEGGCLPPEVLQGAGLQLLQALTAPLQQLQLRGPVASYHDSVSTQDLARFRAVLYWLVTAARGAEPSNSPAHDGERDANLDCFGHAQQQQCCKSSSMQDAGAIFCYAAVVAAGETANSPPPSQLCERLLTYCCCLCLLLPLVLRCHPCRAGNRAAA